MHEVVNLGTWCLKHDAPGATRGMLEGRLTTTYSQFSSKAAPCLGNLPSRRWRNYGSQNSTKNVRDAGSEGRATGLVSQQ
jgi:hypothetical protein